MSTATIERQKDGIVLNIFMTKVEAEEDGGKARLFGKIAFQTQSPKTDRIVLANMRKLEEYLDDGLLTDLEGNTVDDNAVVMFYGRVSRPKSDDQLAQVGGFISASGKSVEVETTEATEEHDTVVEDDQIPY